MNSIPAGGNLTEGDVEQTFEDPEAPITTMAQMRRQVEKADEVLADEKAFVDADDVWKGMETRVPRNTESRGVEPGFEPDTIFTVNRDEVPREPANE